MNEITQEMLNVFDDLQRMQSGKEKNGIAEGAKDRYGYAFEPYDAFSTKPLEFAETALRLDIEAREMFAILRSVNRHSPLFYRLSGPFEKLISQLGSCCITKAVIEQRENDSFELLQYLTIDSLREMTAFQFRKCSAAFMDSRACGKINTEAFAFSVRWAALDKRLIATEEKIRSGKWSVAGGQQKLPVEGDQLPVDGCRLPEKNEQTVAERDLPVSAFAEKGRAFSVLPVEDGQLPVEESTQYSVPGTQQELPVDSSRLPEESDGRQFPTDFSQQSESEDYSEEEDKQFMREILMEEAIERGDRAAYEAVVRASDAELEALSQDLFRRDAANGFPFLKRFGLFEEDPEEPPPENEMAELLEPATVVN